ncbi:MAG: V-type ATPase 116kDa subunit family protein, partial [Armatimonadota bacterium]|nr:V-type ATPase 116kDa subunit family protein [Armatimonadota bacterium]
DETAERERALLEEIVRAVDEAVGPGPAEETAALEGMATDALHAAAREGLEALRQAEARVARLRDELRLLPQYAHLLEAFLAQTYAFDWRPDWAATGLVLDRSREADLPRLRAALEHETRGRMQLAVAVLDTERLAAVLLYDRRHRRAVEDLLWGQGVERLNLPPEFLGKPLEDVLRDIAARRAVLPSQIADAEEAARRLRQASAGFLRAARAVAADRLDELRVATQGLASRRTVALAGWVPAARAPALRAALESAFPGEVFVWVRAPAPHERAAVPVLLDNPRALRPFEVLLQPLRPPAYGTLDPTWMLALFFPLFFGLMLGDAGYGGVLLLGAALMRRWRSPWAGIVRSLLVPMGSSAILFGVLFGEYFGDLARPYLRPLLFDRKEAMLAFLSLALSIGLAHTALGAVLGIVQARRLHEPRRAAERGALLAVLVTLFAIAGALAGLLPQALLVPGVALLVAAVPVLMYAGGLLGAIEAVSVVGNVLSYARLMALGLASLMLAEVANRLGGAAGNVVVGLIVGVLLHALNLVMGTFSPTIQALRLHYVECFSKFYEPGGLVYQPFARKGG